MQKPQAIISEDATNNESGKTGGSIQLSSVRTEVMEEDNRHKKKGMVLPFEPHSITFNDIRYSVDMPQVGITSVNSLLILSILMH